MCDYLTAQNIEKIWLYITRDSKAKFFILSSSTRERDLKDEYFRTCLRAQLCPTQQNLKFIISTLTTVKKKKKKRTVTF